MLLRHSMLLISGMKNPNEGLQNFAQLLIKNYEGLKIFHY